MHLLAFETSGRQGSIALLEGDRQAANVVAERLLEGQRRTAQALAPAVKQLLADAHWPAASVELVAVAVGPGSFTGLRIGVTTAKTFAYAVEASVVAVHTLAVLAAQAARSPEPLWTVMDAQRQELFAARFASTEDELPTPEAETRIVAKTSWLDQLRPGDRVTGPVLDKLQASLPREVVAEPCDRWLPQAATVGRLAWLEFQQGRRDELWTLAPRYYRPSAAEERAAKRNESQAARREGEAPAEPC